MEYCQSWGTHVHRTDDGEVTLCGLRAGKSVDPTATDAICDRCASAEPQNHATEADDGS